MAQFINGVESEEKTATLQIEAIVKDGKAVEVKQSAQLGSQAFVKNEDEDVWECVGVYGRPKSKVEVSFDVFDLGEVADKKEVVAGMHEANTIIPALSFLDEPEKLAALSDAEKKQLENIGIVDLKKLSEGWAPTVHTAIQDAAIAIYQHPEVAVYIPEHNTTTTPGDHADDVDVLLVIGDHELDTQSKYWKFCGYGPCQGGERYAFTWEVPLSFLDEPK